MDLNDVASDSDLKELRDQFRALVRHLKVSIDHCPNKFGPKKDGYSPYNYRHNHTVCEKCDNTGWVVEGDEDDA